MFLQNYRIIKVNMPTGTLETQSINSFIDKITLLKMQNLSACCANLMKDCGPKLILKYVSKTECF